MNYELAKELKKAGFPQDWKNARAFYDDTGELNYVGDCDGFTEWAGNPDGSGFHTPSTSGCGCCSSSIGSSVNNFVRVPTLEELIEACGDFFEGVNTMVVGEKWRATALDKQGYGSTPTIAVARLWLALNKK